MAECSSCGGPLQPDDPRPTLRSEGAAYHLSCAPSDLVDRASEEYRAILRKGVRYFMDKYAEVASPTSNLGARFLDLGRALEGERERRARG